MSTPNEKAKHGNRYDTGPVVGVNVDGLHGGWCHGTFAGHRDLVKDARFAAQISAQVPLGMVTVTASADTPLGAVAALAWRCPGRLLVTEAPDDVIDVLAGEDTPDGVTLRVPG